MTLSQVFTDFGRKFDSDATVSRAAALAYYTTLSIAPFSVISLICLSMLGPDAVSAYSQEVARFLGPEAGRIFSLTIESVKNRPDIGSLTGLISLVTLFLSAGAVFSELRQTLNRIHRMRPVEETADSSFGHTVICFVRDRVLSAGLVLGFIFLLITSLVLSSVIAFFSGLLPASFSVLVSWVGSGVVYVATFSLLFHFVPSNRLRWRDAVRGGFITSAFFLFGKEMISQYLGSSDTATAYGAAGSLVIFLLWIYYSSIILFASAQLNVILAKARIREGGKMAKRTTIPLGLKRRQERRLAVWENDGGQLPENEGDAYLVNGRMVKGWWGHLGWIAHRTVKKLRAFFHVEAETPAP